MNRRTTLLIGLLLGIAVGFLVFGWGNRQVQKKGTALVRQFSFSELADHTGQTNWQILEDRIYDRMPSLAASPIVGRRIVARTEMSYADFLEFPTRFEQKARDLFDKHQALNQAFFDLVQDATRPIENALFRSRISLPRRYYSIGDVQGVADIGYVSEGGRVTVIISLMEGF